MFEWTLGNCAAAALVAGVAASVARCNPSRPALAHFSWLVALGVLVMPPLPLRGTPGTYLREFVGGFLPEESAVALPGPLASPGIDLERFEDDATEASLAAPGVVDSGTVPVAHGSAMDTSVPLSWSGGRSWSFALLAVWITGGALVLARNVRRVVRFERRVRASVPARGVLRADVERVARTFGMPAPAVLLVDGVASPSVWCLGRPRLLWPADAIPEDRRIRATLIAHELAHLARRDHWVSWLEVPASALLWWNPLFWLIRGRIRHFAELSCDAWAVWAYPADRRAFAEALIDIQARTVTAAVPLHGLGATDSEFKDFERRLNMIMQKRVSHDLSKGIAAAALIATLIAAPGFPEGAAKSSTVVPAAVARHVEAAQLLEKGADLQKEGELDEAVAAYRAALERDPENGKVHSKLGYILIGRGELTDAGEHFKQQYKLGHERPTALYNLACVKALAGSDKALGVLEIAVQHGFANTKLMAKDPDMDSVRADERFDSIVALAERGRELKDELRAAKSSGDEALIYGLLVELAHVLSADGELTSNLGHLALKRGDLEEAAWAFERQAEAGHQVANGYYNAACAYALMGNLETGLSMLSRAAEEGMAYEPVRRDGDLDALRSDPRFDSLEWQIAESGAARVRLKQQLAAGDVAAALPELERIAADASRTPKERAWAARAHGQLLQELGRHHEALGAFGRAAALGHGVDRTAFQMAEALTALGEQESALEHVRVAVQLGYDDADSVRQVLAGNALCAPAEGEALVERAAAVAMAEAKKSSKGYWKPGISSAYAADVSEASDASDASGEREGIARKKAAAQKAALAKKSAASSGR